MDDEQANAAANSLGGLPRRRIWRYIKWSLLAILFVAFLAVGGLAWYEATTSHFQSRFLTRIARQMTFRMESGPSDHIRFPGKGPFDVRLGYGLMPQFLARLQSQKYVITEQARISPRMEEVADRGLFPAYREKTQAGLSLLDCQGQVIFSARYPERVYGGFQAVPPLLVQSLLFIENRELLNFEHATKNPAIEWGRFGKAVIDQIVHRLVPDHDAPGGSTLATQIEKYRHSPEGRTASGAEKLRQMGSASLRAYLDGEDTTRVRHQLVVDYLNTVPLAAKPGYGEVIGIGDGLWAWYGRDFDEVNRLLRDDHAEPARRALAFKQALSLMISQRRPSGYLADPATLAKLTDSHLRVLAANGVISAALRDAALNQPLGLHREALVPPTLSFVGRKAATTFRTHLAGMLGMPRVYDLDRLDLTATSTLNAPLQRVMTESLVSIADPAMAKESGLMGERLLSESETAKITYSFTLYERTQHANVVRVQTDNLDQPFDINEGTRLDLGSTAKLRTLVTYLEIIAKLHGRLAPLPANELKAVPIARQDVLTQWAVDYLRSAEDRSLKAMLEAAMERQYSAGTGERFFTGGGMLTFSNFEKEDDSRIMTVREGLQRSVNLLFIRLMRDVVRYTMFNMPSSSATLLDDENDPKRQEYLARFADREGKLFLSRFYRKYQGKTPLEAENILLQGLRVTPKRLAPIFRSVIPGATEAEFAQAMRRNLPDTKIDDSTISKLYEEYSPERFDLADRGYLARVHPLELWLVGYLRTNPKASLKQVFEAGADKRQEVYAWLFKTRFRGSQDRRIKQLVEVEAFLEIHKMWKRLGYPFDSLDPSYATALGSSADRPAALAELMGVLLNDGVRLPTLRIDTLQFARATPYETNLQYGSTAEEQVLPKEVAEVAREALARVVHGGTARRLDGVFKQADGTPIVMGGKTGTGDHRFETYGKGGVVLSSTVVSRSGTFVFYIGDRFFGTVTAYVKGPDAEKLKFTSALPTQILKSLAPKLADEIARPRQDGTRCGPIHVETTNP